MKLEEQINEHLNIIQETFDKKFLKMILAQGKLISNKIVRGGTIFFMGNGGSAADSQHISAEFVSKLSLDRRPLPAIALTVDSSALTAISNDYGFENLFARQITALCNKGDIVVGISTSGTSKNVLAGFDAAKKIGAYTIGLSGNKGFSGIDIDFDFVIHHKNTARIQEAHILLGHLLCQVAEDDFV